jgi:hypothetical protein
MVGRLKNPEFVIEIVIPFSNELASPATTPAAMDISAIGVLMSLLRSLKL